MLNSGGCEFIPRTYSLKGYCKRRTIEFRKIIKGFVYFVILMFALGVVFLTANGLI